MVTALSSFACNLSCNWLAVQPAISKIGAPATRLWNRSMPPLYGTCAQPTSPANPCEPVNNSHSTVSPAAIHVPNMSPATVCLSLWLYEFANIHALTSYLKLNVYVHLLHYVT